MEKVLVNQRKRDRVFKTCATCGVEFSVQPSKALRFSRCSDCLVNCKNKTPNPPKPARKTPTKQCLVCGNDYIATHKTRLYCSWICASEAKRVFYTCDQCGVQFNKKRKYWKNKSTLLFCSIQCRATYISGDRHYLHVDIGPRRRDDRGTGWDKIAESIRKRDSYECQLCGKKQTAKRALDVHHIEPYRINLNNDPSNLVALCLSCHKRAEHHPAMLRLVAQRLQS